MVKVCVYCGGDIDYHGCRCSERLDEQLAAVTRERDEARAATSRWIKAYDAKHRWMVMIRDDRDRLRAMLAIEEPHTLENGGVNEDDPREEW
jgi:hypothetical protein